MLSLKENYVPVARADKAAAERLKFAFPGNEFGSKMWEIESPADSVYRKGSDGMVADILRELNFDRSVSKVPHVLMEVLERKDRTLMFPDGFVYVAYGLDAIDSSYHQPSRHEYI